MVNLIVSSDRWNAPGARGAILKYDVNTGNLNSVVLVIQLDQDQ